MNINIATDMFFEVVMCANEIHDESDVLSWYICSNHVPTHEEVLRYMERNYPYHMRNIDKVDSMEEVTFEEAWENTCCCSLEDFDFLA